jgi:LysM repeat protein
MDKNESPKDVIEAYRKQQGRSQKWPRIIFWSFVVIILIAAAGLVYWFTTGGELDVPISFLASKTPTSTETMTPSPLPPTLTPTLTPTERPPTHTPTITPTPTRDSPFIYVVEEGDTLSSLAEEFEVDVLVLIEANQERLGLDSNNPIIRVGDELLIPLPGTQLSTPTPLPEGLPAGTRIEYMVQPGDTLTSIAEKFNSTVEDILERNEIEDANAIEVGQIIIVRVNLVTPVPTETPSEETTSTPES